MAPPGYNDWRAGLSLPSLQDKTIEYYKKCFGMELLRFRDIPEVGGWCGLVLARSGQHDKYISPSRDIPCTIWVIVLPCDQGELP